MKKDKTHTHTHRRRTLPLYTILYVIVYHVVSVKIYIYTHIYFHIIALFAYLNVSVGGVVHRGWGCLRLLDLLKLSLVHLCIY